MKKIILFIAVAIIFIGCQSTGVDLLVNKDGKPCVFSSIDSKSYKLSESGAKYVTNNFFYNANSDRGQLNKEKYTSLRTQNFKILQTGMVTAKDMNKRKSYLSLWRYKEASIDDIPYIKDNAYSTKIVTEDCSIFYLSGAIPIFSILSAILNKDGSKINGSDVLKLVGDAPLKKKSFDPIIDYDKFTKSTKIRTPYFNDHFLRGTLYKNTKEIKSIQLYVNLIFFDNWGFVDTAVDTDSNTHKVVKIASNTDCSGMSCKLTETIGVSLSEEFLRNNQDGFEIQCVGRRKQVVKVSGIMVKSFLNGIEKAKSRNK